MATHLGKRHIQGLAGILLTLKNPNGTTLSGYVSPNLQSLKLGHKANNKKILNQSGNTGSIIGTDEYAELTFDFVPQGNNDAAARANAGVPQNLGSGTVTGAPIIAFGPFTDVLNTNGVNTQPWIYEAEANLDGKLQEEWGGSITLRRYPDITSGTAVSA